MTGIISEYQSGEDLVVEWKISNFFTLSEEGGRGYASPSFSFGGERWELDISPNGSSGRDSNEHVDVGLCKWYSDRSIKQSFSLSLKTAKGEKYHEEHYTRVFETWSEYHEFNRFIPRSELTMKSSELMPEGVLTVVCTMKSSPPAESDRDIASAQCLHCKGISNADRLSLHQKKCMLRPVKFPDGLEAVVLQKWFDEHECQEKRTEAETSKNFCVEASTQTEGEIAEKSENMCVETSTQTGEENADEWFKEKSRISCAEASTQTEGQNEELKELPIAELNKADTPEVAGSEKAEACDSNQAGTTETKKSVSPVNLPGEHDWMTDVNNFLKEGKGVDVTFELETSSGKTEFMAHQLILALRSPYFRDAFYGTERNNGHQRISLKGIDPKAFQQMIRYCYDDKPCLRTLEDACALFKVAFEFKVLSLQKLCRTFIRDKKIEAKNVFSVLEVSEKMEDRSLGDMCNKLLQDKTRDVMAAYKLCDVTPVMVHTFLNLSNLSLNSEFELIKWMFDWAKVKSKDEDSSSENTREYLKRWLKDMNFLALTIEEFATLCKDNPEFFSSDEMASIYQNLACLGTREMPAWYDNNVKYRVYTGSKE